MASNTILATCFDVQSSAEADSLDLVSSLTQQ